MKWSLSNNLKEWYHAEYPTDDIWTNLNQNVTLEEILNEFLRGVDIYSLVGTSDSVVRERVFEAFAALTLIPYDAIYDQWLCPVDQKFKVIGTD